MQGLEVYNADGTLNFTTADRLTRILLVFSTGSSSGSVSVPGMNTGEPFVVSCPLSQNSGINFFFALVPPAFTIDKVNSVVSWAFQAGSQPCRVTVGVY